MPSGSSSVPAACSALWNARPNVESIPITSPVERISGPSAGSTSGNRENGSTASFTATWARRSAFEHRRPEQSLGAQFGERRAEHHPRRHLRQRHAGRLGDERHGAARPRVRLDDVHRRARHRVLHVDQPAHVEAGRDRRGVRLDDLDHPRHERRRRDRTRRVAGVHPGLLDVLHHAADQHLAGVVAHRVDVDLDRRRRGSGRSAPDGRPTARPRDRATTAMSCSAFSSWSASWTMRIARPPST